MEIYKTPPQGFTAQVEIAACYLEIDNKLLLLQRAHGKFEPGKWGVPAGKLERHETAQEAAKRELFEETGISSSQIQYINSLYMRTPAMDYIYHTFKVPLDQMPEVQLSDEHLDYRWASATDRETMALMSGAEEALQSYYDKVVPI